MTPAKAFHSDFRDFAPLQLRRLQGHRGDITGTHARIGIHCIRRCLVDEKMVFIVGTSV